MKLPKLFHMTTYDDVYSCLSHYTWKTKLDILQEVVAKYDLYRWQVSLGNIADHLHSMEDDGFVKKKVVRTVEGATRIYPIMAYALTDDGIRRRVEKEASKPVKGLEGHLQPHSI